MTTLDRVEAEIPGHKGILAEIYVSPVTVQEAQTVWFHDISRASDDSVLGLLEIRYDEFIRINFLPGTDLEVMWNMFEETIQDCLLTFDPHVEKKGPNNHHL